MTNLPFYLHNRLADYNLSVTQGDWTVFKLPMRLVDIELFTMYKHLISMKEENYTGRGCSRLFL